MRRKTQAVQSSEQATHGSAWKLLSLLLKHRQNITSRVFEPGDVRTGTASNTLFVCFEIALVVMLKTHTEFGEPVYSLFNIGYRKIKNGKGCRSMVRLGIDEYPGATPNVQFQSLRPFRNLESQSLTIELFGLFQIVYRKTRECFCFFEHKFHLIGARVRSSLTLVGGHLAGPDIPIVDYQSGFIHG